MIIKKFNLVDIVIGIDFFNIRVLTDTINFKVYYMMLFDILYL